MVFGMRIRIRMRISIGIVGGIWRKAFTAGLQQRAAAVPKIHNFGMRVGNE